MTGGRSFGRALWAGAAALAWGFAAFVAADTMRTVLRFRSPLPWFDAWASFDLLQRWRGGEVGTVEALVSQHNEHRILVPRLVFFADDMLAGGQGTLCLAAIFAVQALHAAVFAAVLARARGPGRAGGWVIAGAIAALMFGLRQGENFSSGFQLQFVAVFAGATLTFALVAAAASGTLWGASGAVPLALALAALLATALTMANGLIAGVVAAFMALAARLRPRVVSLLLASAVLLAALYLWGYEPVAHHSRPADSLRRPLRLLLYVATYLGSWTSGASVPFAAAVGGVGAVAAAGATVRALRRGPAAVPALAMVGVMLFVVGTAALTGLGRLDFGADQALSSRYATGSAAFWAAQLSYWWVDPPAPPRRVALARGAVVALAAMLCWATAAEQTPAKLPLAVQRSAQDRASDLLMLGLFDPAVAYGVSWLGPDLPALLLFMRDERLSIFGTADYRALGRPASERRPILSPDPCGGALALTADPSLGADGVRAAGIAWDGPDRRPIRRLLLVGPAGTVVGFGSGAVPGAAPAAWRGFAVAPAGTAVTAYGVVAGQQLCRVGDAVVAP